MTAGNPRRLDILSERRINQKSPVGWISILNGHVCLGDRDFNNLAGVHRNGSTCEHQPPYVRRVNLRTGWPLRRSADQLLTVKLQPSFSSSPLMTIGSIRNHTGLVRASIWSKPVATIGAGAAVFQRPGLEQIGIAVVICRTLNGASRMNSNSGCPTSPAFARKTGNRRIAGTGRQQLYNTRWKHIPSLGSCSTG